MTVRVTLKPQDRKSLNTIPSPSPSTLPAGRRSPGRPVAFNPPLIPHIRQPVIEPDGRVRCEFIYPGDRLQYAVSHCPRPALDLVEMAVKPIDIMCEFGGVVKRKLPAYYYANDKRRPSTCSDDTRQSVPTSRLEVRRYVRGPSPGNRSALPASRHRLSPQSISEYPAAGRAPPPPTPVGTRARGSLFLRGNADSPRRRLSVPAFHVTDRSAKTSLQTNRRNSLYVTDHTSTSTSPIAHRIIRH